MKFRLSLQLPEGGTHDVTLTCDATATVADLAHTLIRAGFAADPVLTRIAEERLRPVTVLGVSPTGDGSVLLDPGSLVVASGMQSGWTIVAVPEFGSSASVGDDCSRGVGYGVGSDGGARRLLEPVGYLQVLSGAHDGALYSLLPGPNLIGRDPAARVYVGDRDVSRRHAMLEIRPGGRFVLRDLGSANGTRLLGDAHGVRGRGVELNGAAAVNSAVELNRATEFEVGGVLLRFTPGPPMSGQDPELTPHARHTRSPRVDRVFAPSSRQLPAPPAAAVPDRIPTIALLAPVLMGGVLYLVTRSPMSLMMMAFAPVMMIGSWVDGRLRARRGIREAGNKHADALAAERLELQALQRDEQETRGGETPTLSDIAAAMGERTGLLWARRPEHDAFLSVQFGDGTLPSRTSLALPERGDSGPDAWRAVRELEADFASVPDVPVLENLKLCGSIGVAGPPQFAVGLARSLVLQLVGLHSPEELVLACFAGPTESASWEWLKWLPHVDTVTSPVGAWQLADDAASTLQLLLALEALVTARRGGAVAANSSPALPAVAVLVLAGAEGVADEAIKARLIELAETGPGAGVHLIWVAATQAQLPAACRTFVVLGDETQRAEPSDTTNTTNTVSFVRTSERVTLTRLEYVDAPVAAQLARSLAPVTDAAARALDESDLPKSVALREIHPVDLTAGAAPIRNAWQTTLTSHWQRGADREPVELAAPVGQGPAGPATIDLRRHGPHALVGGTTGAGKSEFLQTWIMSLAATVSPDRLTFLLVDYKGGAAFAECVELPHTVGLVTDLTPHLVRRALTSLRAELRYREELLAEHDAKDLITMERRSDPAAPPVLVIVIDEFAALAAEVPEFVDGVVDVAQRGRSLGLHLILATQRPAGVIKDNLRANTNLRIALRMADETDSSDVIGVKDAALFDPETPGRGVIKVGAGRIEHFQTGYLGGRTASGTHAGSHAGAPSRASAVAPAGAGADAREPAIELRSLGFSEGDPWAIAPRLARATAACRLKPPRDIERLRDSIAQAAREEHVAAPRRPWLDTLPDRIPLEGFGADTWVAGVAGAAGPAGRSRPDEAVAVGVRDAPEQQAQLPVLLDLERTGNIALTGVSGTGKTSTLITLAVALSAQTTQYPVELYALDAAGGALDALRALPTVSAVAPITDTELTGRVLQKVRDRLTARSRQFAAARCNGLTAYRRTAGENLHTSRIVLLVDGFATFRQTAEAPGGAITQLQQLSEIMTQGRAAGVHVVLTTDRPGAIPAALAASVQEQYVLRLANPAEYAHLGVPGDVLEDAPPGRAVLAGASKRPGSRGAQGRHASAGAAVSEIQFALAGGEPELQAQVRAVETLAGALKRAGVLPVAQVRNAPAHVSLHELTDSDRPSYGIRTTDFAPVSLPVRGLGVIAGPGRSGLSTAAETCVEAVEQWHSVKGEAVECVLLTLTHDGLRHRGSWNQIAYGEAAVAELAAELTIVLGGKPPPHPSATELLGAASPGEAVKLGGHETAIKLGVGPDPESRACKDAGNDTAAATANTSRGAAPKKIIVIERPSAAEGTPALAALVSLIKVARRADALVLVEFEQGTGGAIWDLFTALKQPTWGLALQPDEAESQSPFREPLGRVKRANFPPGRGFAIEGGRVTPIHVATVSKGKLARGGIVT